MLSLASGVVAEFSPEIAVASAAEAGYDAAGLWLDLRRWSPAWTRTVRRALEASDLVALDIEAVWFQPDSAPDAFDRFVDVGVDVAARNLLVVSSDPDAESTKRRFERLCRRAEGSGLRVALEFFGATEVNSLAKALDVVTGVDHPSGALLIDTLHLARTGSLPSDLKGIDPKWLPYAQICDAAEQPAEPGPAGLFAEAIGGRLLPGEGVLPLAETLAVLPPSIPLSIELRSRALSERFPDPVERARCVLEATRKLLTTA